jgi:hypothetical protein
MLELCSGCNRLAVAIYIYSTYIQYIGLLFNAVAFSRRCFVLAYATQQKN